MQRENRFFFSESTNLTITAFIVISVQDNKSIPVISAGLPEGVDAWCSAAVQGDAQACRAKRSVRIVDSRNDPEFVRHSVLTGMYNRRFLEEFSNSLEANVNVSRRSSSLGVLMCDIDLFKQVNDKRGHASGDRVLVETADILKDAVRASVLIVRYSETETKSST